MARGDDARRLRPGASVVQDSGSGGGGLDRQLLAVLAAGLGSIRAQSVVIAACAGSLQEESYL